MFEPGYKPTLADKVTIAIVGFGFGWCVVYQLFAA